MRLICWLEGNRWQLQLGVCRVYGVAAWDVDLDGAQDAELIISPADQPTITFDRLINSWGHDGRAEIRPDGISTEA